ncbi:MAG: hypothetical protein ACTSXQ_04965 [Alphaproteobacteria bacterium]
MGLGAAALVIGGLWTLRTIYSRIYRTQKLKHQGFFNFTERAFGIFDTRAVKDADRGERGRGLEWAKLSEKSREFLIDNSQFTGSQTVGELNAIKLTSGFPKVRLKTDISLRHLNDAEYCQRNEDDVRFDSWTLIDLKRKVLSSKLHTYEDTTAQLEAIAWAEKRATDPQGNLLLQVERPRHQKSESYIGLGIRKIERAIGFNR